MKKFSIVLILSSFAWLQSFGQAWQWAKDFGGPSTDGGNMTCTDPSGNVFVGGYFGSASINVGSVVMNNAGATGTDVFISKYDANGNALWAQRIAGTASEFLNDICSDANGRVYVIGSFTSPTLTIPPFSVVNANNASSTQDIFVACFDSFGSIQWLKSFGGANSDSGEGVIYSNTQSSLYITGNFSSTSIVVGSTTLTNANGSGSNSDMFLAKLTSAGNITWALRTGGANSSDSGVDLGLDASNQYPYVGGTFSPPSASTPTTQIGSTILTTNGNTDFFIAKYSDTGVFQWARSGGSTSSSDGFAELTVDGNNDCYIAGNYFGATLNIGTTSLSNSGSMDGFIAKYNASGTLQWAKKVFTSGNTTNDDTWSISADSGNNIYVGGSYSSTVVTNGSLSFTNTVAGSSSDIYAIKFNSSGSLLWGLNAQGSNYEGVRGLSADAFGNVYLTGTHNISGPPTFGATTLTNYGGNDGFVAKLSCRTPTITTTNANFSVCPNSINSFSIAINSPQSDVTYSWSAIGASGVNFSSSTGTITTVSYTATTSFSIVVTGTNACSTSSVIAGSVVINSLPNVSAIASPTAVCAGGLLTLTGTGANTYSWSNGVSDGSPFQPASSLTYTVSGTDLNGCTNTATINVDIINLPMVAVTGNSVTCLNSLNALTANGASTYTWMPGALTGTTVNVQPASTTVYTVNATATSGCTNSATFAVTVAIPQTPDICEVTVDSISQYNNIVWDKTLYNNVDSFIVYREVSTGNYRRIGAQHQSAYSLFIDTARSVGPANGDPNITSYRYKLQIRDTCGNYGALSPYHNTIYFLTNSSGSFFWNTYLVEFQPLTPISTFDLIRDNNATGNWTVVGSCAGNQTSLNDAAYSSYPNAIYRVIGNGFSCNATAKTAQQLNKSKSNVKNNFNVITAVSVNKRGAFSIAPNPASSEIMVVFNDEVKEITTITVTNVLGKVVSIKEVSEGNEAVFPLNELANGVYFIRVQQGNNFTTKKFIKN